MNEKSITIIDPGLLSTVQDTGRHGYQKYGVPVSGAMDNFSLRAANLLVGNTTGSACIEMTIVGASIKFNYPAVISITGGNLSMKLDGAKINNWCSIQVESGSVLKSDGAQDGMRAYLAIKGGINVPVIMGSKSTYIPASFGGFKGRALIAGDTLLINNSDVEPIQEERNLPEGLQVVHYGHSHIVRVTLGPQHNKFTSEAIKTFFDSRYSVSSNCDRVGYRLTGPQLQHESSADIISDGTQFGSIQVPSDGNPIILMADRGPTGGYAKIGTVISADLNLIAQSRPGDSIVFRQVSVKEAESAFFEQETFLYSMNPKLFKNAPEKVRTTLSKNRSTILPLIDNDTKNKPLTIATANIKGKIFNFEISIESN